MSFEMIIAEKRGRVGLITLNRPKALERTQRPGGRRDRRRSLDDFESDEGIGAIVITGSEKAFAAGADIGAMANFSHGRLQG